MTHKILTAIYKQLICTGLCLLFSIPHIYAQKSYPQNYFINPLDIPITLAGTFGEVRSNHFHTGLDMRTDGKEGLVVHAAADGYVSRINVSAYGYGNALYITHPNGYVTVYGHLSRYNKVIADYVKMKQYELQRFSVDLFLKPGEIPVKKGDTVAFSGSTGAAEGPHLHFEIRDAKTEDPINPLLFGYTYSDHEAPFILGICIYPLNDSSNVDGKHEPLYLKALKSDNGYVLATDSEISAYGKIGIGIRTYDMAEEVENHNGVFSQILVEDKDTVYFSQMDELSFYTVHYVNGHIDYTEFKKHRETIEHSFQQDNDRLKIYKKLRNRGIILCKAGKVHHMLYSISDFPGNTSTLPFNIYSESHSGPIFHDTTKYRAIINWRKPFSYTYQGMSIYIPADAAFTNLRFRCSSEETTMHTLCPIYHIMDEYTPLAASYTIKLKPTASLPDSILKKAVIVEINGKHLSSLGGVWENNYLVAHAGTFGDFSIMFDLIRPNIEPVNIYPNKNMSKENAMEFRIGDNLSGVASFNAYVDNKWILMEFNPKKAMIYYTFDSHVGSGKHHLKLVVTDNVGNTNIYEVDFTR